jgi:hypothetical protein
MKIWKIIISGKIVHTKKYVKTKLNIFVLDVSCIIANFAIRGATRIVSTLSKKNLINLLMFGR